MENTIFVVIRTYLEFSKHVTQTEYVGLDAARAYELKKCLEGSKIEIWQNGNLIEETN